MSQILSILLASVALLNVASGFPNGAPKSVCVDMTPQHGDHQPQTIPFPFDISFRKSTVRPGETVEVRIVSRSGQSFRGFMLQGRRLDSHDMMDLNPAGSFVSKDGMKTIDCFGIPKNSITHSHNHPRTSLFTKWKAPDRQGSYTILTTIVEDGTTFWVRQHSPTITVV